jgi:hypothetical protein
MEPATGPLLTQWPPSIVNATVKPGRAGESGREGEERTLGGRERGERALESRRQLRRVFEAHAETDELGLDAERCCLVVRPHWSAGWNFPKTEGGLPSPIRKSAPVSRTGSWDMSAM